MNLGYVVYGPLTLPDLAGPVATSAAPVTTDSRPVCCGRRATMQWAFRVQLASVVSTSSTPGSSSTLGSLRQLMCPPCIGMAFALLGGKPDQGCEGGAACDPNATRNRPSTLVHRTRRG